MKTRWKHKSSKLTLWFFIQGPKFNHNKTFSSKTIISGTYDSGFDIWGGENLELRHSKTSSSLRLFTLLLWLKHMKVKHILLTASRRGCVEEPLKLSPAATLDIYSGETYYSLSKRISNRIIRFQTRINYIVITL